MASFSTIPLTEPLWNDLRARLLIADALPSWARDVLSMPFDRVQQLPVHPSRSPLERPKAWGYDRAAYLESLERVNYGSTSSKTETVRRTKISALRQSRCRHICEVDIISNDGLFRSIFADGSNELLHAEVLPRAFVAVPKWQQLLLSWRAIGIVTGLLASVAYATSPDYGAALMVFLGALVVFILILYVFGPRQVVEAAIPAFFIALLGGLLMGMWSHAVQRRQGLEIQQELKQKGLHR